MEVLFSGHKIVSTLMDWPGMVTLGAAFKGASYLCVPFIELYFNTLNSALKCMLPLIKAEYLFSILLISL